MRVVREAFEAHQLTRTRALRAVLGDHAWHGSTELARRVGHRFGASVLEVRRGDDGGEPWLIEAESVVTSGAMWRYRFVRVVSPDEVAVRKSLKSQLAVMQRERDAAVQALQAMRRELARMKHRGRR